MVRRRAEARPPEARRRRLQEGWDWATWALVLGCVVAVLSAGAATWLTIKQRAQLAERKAHVQSAWAPDQRLSQGFANLVVQSTDDVVHEQLAAAKPPADAATYAKQVQELFMQHAPNISTQALPSEDLDGVVASGILADPAVFDAYSYAQFKAAARIIKDAAQRHALTQRVGERVLSLALSSLGFEPSNQLSDIENMKQGAGEIVTQLQEWGYVTDGGITWDDDIINTWTASPRHGKFQYWMKHAAILPSAQKLYEEEGFAQHFSSRTIEAFFAKYGVDASEDPDFDPRQHPADLVVEQWTLKAAA
eukprot:jgi/Chlat1/6073/Chrsp4S06216